MRAPQWRHSRNFPNMQFNTLKRKTRLKTSARVGRGGKRGKTSGRGTKGQKARAGHKMRPEMRDIIKKLPKRRGYGKNRARTVNASAPRAATVSLTALERFFEDGAVISPKSLLTAGVIRRVRGKIPSVKIVGDAKIEKNFTVADCAVSGGARKVIEEAGGRIS